ncbi:phage virion morphogenesis protein [Escherichia coli]|uniref:phage virion morphogenesis protein n=1 Tax=Escherichia coli TaxID=562 RepID=UPI0017A0D4E9|nr:phage virion morphogenesis protein [Escherichia coli]EFN8622499.1 phage virion morphogenesis protein [Escherichia coli O51]EFE7002697.1 phage virion morphogenesis protein [Escherichia coli]EFG1024219.1 phage virion morphogenesis protein [Escherichia coli]EFG7806563.1 phage virion morphogenesis protein [Escherichia coli]EFK3716881.1 phage virion morphogenesis protein [Escherichia coli]
MSKLMIVLVVLLSLAVAGLFLVKHKNASLRALLDRANNVASEQQTTIIRASPEQASMEFYGGKSPKIASVHQFGLSEENRKDGKKIDYPARPLLGFTGEDVQMIEEIILAHLER